MSKFPLVPSSSKEPEAQRLLTGVRDIVLELLVRARIIRAPEGVQALRCPSGYAAVADWGVLNRADPPYSGAVVLPQLRADKVNVPLYFAKAVATGFLRVLASPVAPGIVPAVNGSPTGAYATGAGLYRFVTDGRDWFY